MTAVPCASCTDEARCDRAGLCQTFARQQLQREEKTEMVTWRPATATNLPDADETVLIACDTQFHSEPVWLGFHDGKGWREAGGEPAFVTHWARMLAGPSAVAVPTLAEVDAMLNRLRELRGDRPFDEVRQAFNAAADRLEVLASKLSDASKVPNGSIAPAWPLKPCQDMGAPRVRTAGAPAAQLDRYDLRLGADTGPGMEADPDGEWVRWDDVQRAHGVMALDPLSGIDRYEWETDGMEPGPHGPWVRLDDVREALALGVRGTLNDQPKEQR